MSDFEQTPCATTRLAGQRRVRDSSGGAAARAAAFMPRGRPSPAAAGGPLARLPGPTPPIASRTQHPWSARNARWFAMVLLVGAALAAAVPARAAMSAEQCASTLAAAQSAFDQGAELARSRPTEAAAAYRRSADLFSSLAAAGVENGKLYYNAGNAWFQAGDVGPAILNYRRAERLIGRDAQLQANLRYARSVRRTQLEAGGERALLRTMFFWHYDTSTAARWIVALAAYVAFWALLTVRTLGRRPVGRYAALAALVIWVTAGASVGVEQVQRRLRPEGVTVTDDITVRKGNGEVYDPQFKEPIHAGVEFTILEERPGWYKIELPNGGAGWLRTDQAEIL